MPNSAIRFDSVSKQFKISLNRPQTIQEVFLRLVGARRYQPQETFWAVRDVSFSVSHGETVGFIGANGAGKSTLLKLASRIIFPTSGEIATHGRVAALLELGTGFHPDLTGRENIYLNSSLMGLDHQRVQGKVDEIIAFSELGKFIDTPVKHYSSGMYMRLGFSIAVHVDPDILLIDEVLAVGDQAFQQKCHHRVERLSETGVTILFVSHSLEAVRSICQRAIWMDNGQVRADGDTDWVTQLYSNHLWDQMESRLPQQDAHAQVVDQPAEQPGGDPVKVARRWGSHQIEILGVTLLDQEDSERRAFSTGQPMTVRVHYVARQPTPYPVFGLAVYSHDGLHITGPNSQEAGVTIPSVAGTGWVQCTLEALPLLSGRYELSVAVYDQTLSHAYDHHHRMYTFLVRGETMPAGLIQWPGRWEIHHD